MATMISYALMTIIIIMVTIPLVIVVNDMLEENRLTELYTYNIKNMKMIDSQIRQVMFEAPGSRRTIDVSVGDGIFEIVGSEDTIKLLIENTKTFSPGKTKDGNIVIKSGTFMTAEETDVDNDGITDLVLENNAILFAMKKMGSPSDYVFINTTNMISLIRNIRADVNATPVSGIYINDKLNTSYGYGYTEITRKGESLSSSGIHLWMNSTSGEIYEALFTLDALSDFVALEIRHIS